MTTRTDRIQVIFEVGGDGKLKATLGDVGKAGEQAAQGLDKASAAKERMQIAAIRAAGVLGTAVVAGLGAMVTGLGLVIKNTMEAERVDAQLEARLKSTASAAGMTKQALDDLATATARKTTFDDEAVKSAEAMLLTFTKIHADVFPRAIDAITDMATAMGTDLESASVQVGKALNSPIEGVSALTRVGVQFTEEQENLIKSLVETGQQAQAQAIILKELETQFGGAAEAARDTLSGALVALKNTLMDLTEGGGGSLRQATAGVNALTDALNDPDVKAGADAVTSSLLSIVNGSVQAVAWLGNVVTALREYYGAAGNGSVVMLQNKRTELETDLFRAQRRSGQGLGDASDPIGRLFGMASGQDAKVAKIKADIAEVDAAIARQQKASKDAMAAAGVAAGFAGVGGARPASGATGTGSRTTRASGGSRASAPRAMPDFGDDDLRDLQRLVEETARADEQFARLAATLAGPLSEAQYEYEQNLREITELGEKSGRASEEIAALKAQETERYEKQRREIEASLDPMGQLLESYQQEIDLMGMGNAERAMANLLRREGIDLAGAEAQAYMAAARATDQQAREVADSLGYAEDAKGVLKDFWMDMSKDAKGTLQDIDSYFAAFIDKILSRWMDSQLDQMFSNLGKGGSGGGGGGFWSMLGGLFSGGGGSSGAASSAGSSMLGWIGAGYANGGVHGPNGPIPLRTYASGGIAHSPQMALFGEGRVPEAYVPLQDGRSIPVTMRGGGGGGDTYVINNNIRGDVTARTADQLADKLSQKIQRAGRNR